MTQVTIEIETAPGVWQAVPVYQRNPVAITRGRSDETTQSASPQTLAFTIDNDGTYSPRNPLSLLYNKVGRNTPVRCLIEDGAFSRFDGEISSFPPKWDMSGADQHVPIEAAGILRRLGQGQSPITTALKDYILGQSPSFLQSLAAYYQLGGGEGTTFTQNTSPGKSGSFRAVHGAGGPLFTYGKEMPAWIGTGMELDTTGSSGYMTGSGSLISGDVALEFVWRSSDLGVLTPSVIDNADDTWAVAMNTSGDAGTLQVSFTPSGGSTSSFTATAALDALQDQKLHHFRLLLEASGADTNYTVYIDGTSVDSGTRFGNVISGCQETRFKYARTASQLPVTLAHVVVWVGATAGFIPPVGDMSDAAHGYDGETAAARISRVAADAGVPVTVEGVIAESMPMGPQVAEPHLAAIRDAEATDLGILTDARGSRSLKYRTRTSLYNQTAKFTLDYALGQIAPPLEPVDDDQMTRNDVTATRRDGGSAQYTVDTGRLSTQDPPTGVGRYDTEVTVNTQTDDQLPEIASWVANIGTLDKARWPSVSVFLSVSTISIGSALATAILNADVGDKITLKNLQAVHVYDQIDLIITGYTETIEQYVHTITFVCVPAEPYEVFVIESTGSRISSGETSELNASLTTAASSMKVLSADGVTLWTTDPAQFPIPVMVGGEEMTVDFISGTTPGAEQTFSVTRSVNGVVKTHAVGEVVRLKRRAVLAL